MEYIQNSSLHPFNETPTPAPLSSDSVKQVAVASQHPPGQTQSTSTQLQAPSAAKNVKDGSHVATL